ncbi:MAG: HAD hydrolase family protein [Verrucomicrobia bacterium]|jgi:3-deoxy-D-manno-octulosonate 8-phosphate phosphatase (KDO 8-P phosphatase)|nr:HAD hydrolase family protein [Verrucomicrobiota bacterium]
MPPLSLKNRLRRVRLLLCDVDGVMTDGSVFMGPGGEFKQYNIPDGLGLLLVRRSGIRVGWVSARPSEATRVRARDLKIDFLLQPTDGKVPATETLLRKLGMKWEAVCFVGDDVLDLGMLRRAGLAIAPANGVPEARALAHHVTRARGGHGAVREVCELILKAQGKWEAIVARHAD